MNEREREGLVQTKTRPFIIRRTTAIVSSAFLTLSIVRRTALVKACMLFGPQLLTRHASRIARIPRCLLDDIALCFMCRHLWYAAPELPPAAASPFRCERRQLQCTFHEMSVQNKVLAKIESIRRSLLQFRRILWIPNMYYRRYVT
jgi:hypothetical protein